MCGCEVDDYVLVCPDCGATVVKATAGLSLKAEAEKHKTTASLGKTIGSGSGYTDILRAEDDDTPEDDPFKGGSMPASMARNFIEEEARKKKQKHGRVIKGIIKFAFFVALVALVYLFVTKVVLKKNGVDTPEKAIEVFVESINNGDATALSKIMLPYYYQGEEAEDMIQAFSGVKISGNRVVGHKDNSRFELDSYQEDLKAEKNKMVDIHDGVTYTIEVRGTTTLKTGSERDFGGEVELQFFKIKGNWYLNTDDFNYEFFIPDYYK